MASRHSIRAVVLGAMWSWHDERERNDMSGDMSDASRGSVE